MSNVEKVVSFLSSKGYTLTAAESCTGGLIASTVTSVPGSSAVFEGGFVTYSERMKTKLLGVSAEVLEKSGVYSFDTVEAMAKGALEVTGANIAIAVSGIAGPGGGTEKDPVGTVYFCLYIKGVKKEGRDCNCLRLYRHVFGGTRQEVRQAAAEFGFEKLTEELGL